MEWLRPAWAAVDNELSSWAKTLKKWLLRLRLLRAVWMLSILAAYVGAAWAVVDADRVHYALALAIVGLTNALWMQLTFIDFPLRRKSIVRLIDKGYPANARELAIRAAVRKLHDESIETEELLVNTVWNESKKAYRMYKEKAAAMADEPEEA